MGTVSFKKHFPLILISLIINGLCASLTFPVIKCIRGESTYFIKKTLGDPSSKAEAEEEDANEESNELEEDTWEEESILSEFTSIGPLLNSWLNVLYNQAVVFYNCLFVNQILTPPKLNV